MEHDEALKEIGELSAAIREFLQGIGLSGEFMILLNQEDGTKRASGVQLLRKSALLPIRPTDFTAT